MKQLHFILPEVDSFISGGNLYNRYLLEAVAKMSNLSLSCFSIDKVPPSLSSLEGNFCIVDSLYLSDIAKRIATKRKEQIIYLLVHHLQSMYPEEGLDEQELLLQELQQLSLFDGFIVTSQYTAQYLKKHKLFQPRVVLPPVPIVEKKNNPIPRTSTPINALIVANLIPRKGILPFLKMLKNRVAGEVLDITITIVGETSLDGAYSKACLQYVENANELQRIINIKGPLPPNEITTLYESSNLLISVAGFETFGMALQEAVCYGLPILALKGGNIENHIQEGKNGYVFEQLSDLVVKLIQLTKNPSLLANLLPSADALRNHQYPDNWKTQAKKLVSHLSVQRGF